MLKFPALVGCVCILHFFMLHARCSCAYNSCATSKGLVLWVCRLIEATAVQGVQLCRMAVDKLQRLAIRLTLMVLLCCRCVCPAERFGCGAYTCQLILWNAYVSLLICCCLLVHLLLQDAMGVARNVCQLTMSPAVVLPGNILSCFAASTHPVKCHGMQPCLGPRLVPGRAVGTMYVHSICQLILSEKPVTLVFCCFTQQHVPGHTLAGWLVATSVD
jgi:hypothetical protein